MAKNKKHSKLTEQEYQQIKLAIADEKSKQAIKAWFAISETTYARIKNQSNTYEEYRDLIKRHAPKPKEAVAQTTTLPQEVIVPNENEKLDFIIDKLIDIEDMLREQKSEHKGIFSFRG